MVEVDNDISACLTLLDCDKSIETISDMTLGDGLRMTGRKLSYNFQ